MKSIAARYDGRRHVNISSVAESSRSGECSQTEAPRAPFPSTFDRDENVEYFQDSVA